VPGESPELDGAAPRVPRGAESDARHEAYERGKRIDEGGAAGEPKPPASLENAHAAAHAFVALAENVRDYAIFLMNPEGIITHWGEGARLIKGWTPQEAQGGHLRMLYPDGGSEDGTAESHLRNAAADGESVSEGQRVRRDGSTFWAGATLTALRDSDGTLMGFAKVTRDLTARRAADAALMAANEAGQAKAAAEAAMKARNELMATVSHEIRTPINALLGYAGLLIDGVSGELNDRQRHYVERITIAAKHLRELALDVVNLARAEGEETLVEGAVGNIGTALQAALTLVEPQAQERDARIIDEVSTSASGLSYWGDEARVRQILVNLLANAVKFTESREGLPATVTITAGGATQPPASRSLPGKGPWICVRIQDTGPGIPTRKLESIFEPFVQVERKGTERETGSGLGLAISRQLARRMCGDISVDSTEGVGATFTLWLPVAAVESVATGGA
jgi:PAS domain S-box-containing protein